MSGDSKDQKGQSRSSSGGNRLVNTVLVLTGSVHGKTKTTLFLTIIDKSDVAQKSKLLQPLYKKLQLIAYSYMGNTITLKILETSLRISTHSRYNNYIKQWLSYSKNMH